MTALVDSIGLIIFHCLHAAFHVLSIPRLDLTSILHYRFIFCPQIRYRFWSNLLSICLYFLSYFLRIRVSYHILALRAEKVSVILLHIANSLMRKKPRFQAFTPSLFEQWRIIPIVCVFGIKKSSMKIEQ